MSERTRIVRIVSPDYDSYAVIHLEGGGAFGAGKEWCDIQRPEVGDYVVDEAWPSPSKPSFTYHRKVVKDKA